MLLRTFRKLRKQKVTRIHMNLFASMILQSLVRLVIYIDQLVVREDGFTVGAGGDGGGGTRGIDNTVGGSIPDGTGVVLGKKEVF